MALFKRTKSPRDTKDRHVIAITPVSEEDQLLSGHRRHKSVDNIEITIDPAIFDKEPPELPPRNRVDSSGSYRRTQSSGTIMSTSSSFKTQSHAGRNTQEDYNVPADIVRKLALVNNGPQTIQDKRNMTMHHKIMSHNDPEFKATQPVAPRSIDKVMDNPDYSIPFDIIQEQQQANNLTSNSRPPPKPKRHTTHGRVKIPDHERGSTQPPPDYQPPPPPFEEIEEIPPSADQQNSSPHSPHITIIRAGDYDDPWDSKKFKKLRSKSDVDSKTSSSSSTGNISSTGSHIDPYKSPSSSTKNLHSTSPPPPPLPPFHHHHDDHPPSHDDSQSPNPPTTCDRTRVNSGESTNHEYVNQPPLVHDMLRVSEYVNQPALPPTLPPRVDKTKQHHSYPPLIPTANLSYPPDISQHTTPAFPVDPSIILEEQLWYHGNLKRDQAEDILKNQPDFSFLVRNSESCRMDYSLSIRDRTSPAANGFIHLKISDSGPKGYILGQFSSPFRSVPDCIAHYAQHPLTIKNINHRRLRFPVGRIEFSHHQQF